MALNGEYLVLSLHFYMHTTKMANSKSKATKQCHVTCRSQLNRAFRARDAKQSATLKTTQKVAGFLGILPSKVLEFWLNEGPWM